VAGVLAYAFWPVVSAAQNRTGLPRALVIAIGYVVVLGALGVVGFLAAERAGSELRELTSGGRDIIASAMQKLFGNTIIVAGQRLVVADVAAEIRSALLGVIQSPTGAVQVATQAVDLVLQAVLTLIVTFYFLMDGQRFSAFALRFLDRSQRADAIRIADRIHVVLGRWLRGQLLLIALVAAVIYVLLGPVLHVPFALALGGLSGILEIIPLVGPVIAAALACTVAFAAHGTDTTLVVLAIYVIVRQVEDQVIMPLVIGRAVHLHPVITIFAVLVGLSSWGIFGGLMGVPVAAALNVTLHELYPEETRSRVDPDAPRRSPRVRLTLRRLVRVGSAAGEPQARRVELAEPPAAESADK
jgi:predicted PurR-regulated permease PerM